MKFQNRCYTFRERVISFKSKMYAETHFIIFQLKKD